MLAADQSEVIGFLADPASHGPGIDRVERIDTHGAVVFLAGDRAYKLKRAVRYPYMDFSTLELRRRACAAEIELNRRTAPTLYLEARAVRRGPGGLAFAADGDVVDWVVVMRRFDEAGLFDRLAAAGRLTPDLIATLAEEIAEFHGAAERLSDAGGADNLDWVIAGNDRQLAAAPAGLFDTASIAALSAQSRAALARLAPLLEERRRAGFVRRCHGDLHLRNICLVDGRPTLFDAIEFNDLLSCIDTLYDLAFLLVDLERRGLRALANLAFNRYLEATADYGGIAALPLMLACRGGIKAHTRAASAAAQPRAAAREPLIAEARRSLALAIAALPPPPPCLIAVGGLSGTGKSELARRLAPEIGAMPGAIVLRTDVIRKRQAGVGPGIRLGQSRYTAESTEAVYRELVDRARAIIAAGHAAIVDAVFADPRERAAAAAAAGELGVKFTGLWLTAPAAVLEQRIAGRRGDASDATAAVLRRQLGYNTANIAWFPIDASGTPADTLEAARKALT